MTSIRKDAPVQTPYGIGQATNQLMGRDDEPVWWVRHTDGVDRVLKECELTPLAPAKDGLPVDHPIIPFLLGESALEGFWFGESRPDVEGKFWWRSVLREAVTQRGGDING